MEITDRFQKYKRFKDFLPYQQIVLHHAIRQGIFSPKKISIITPTKKPQYMNNIFNNYDRQIYPQKELVIILNNNQINIDRWRTRGKDYQNVQVYQLDEAVTLGECLNYAVSKATGYYIARFDDDDYYGANYLRDQIACLVATNNMLVGKACQFVYFEAGQKIIICNLKKAYKYVNKSISGGSLVLTRDVFWQIKFRKQDIAEDYHFIQDCIRKGYKIYSSDPFNYLIIRHRNLADHTWKVNSSEFISWGNLIPAVQEPRSFVTI